MCEPPTPCSRGLFRSLGKACDDAHEPTLLLIAVTATAGACSSRSVPARLETDFASVPRVPLWLFPRHGLQRAEAGRIFRVSTRELGGALVRRWAMWC
ncbi:DUF1353 domain-containing protein [Streptomyces sp. NPDC002092]